MLSRADKPRAGITLTAPAALSHGCLQSPGAAQATPALPRQSLSCVLAADLCVCSEQPPRSPRPLPAAPSTVGITGGMGESQGICILMEGDVG